MCQKDLDAYLEAVLGLVHLKHQCILNGSFRAGLANGGCKMHFLLAMGFRFLKVGGSCEVKIKFSLFFFFSLRSPKAPDENADMGTHTFCYGIMPHNGE